MTLTSPKSLIDFFREKGKENKEEGDFFSAIGYTTEQYNSIKNLEDDFTDRLFLTMKKKIRGTDDGKIQAYDIFINAINSEEGEKYLRLLEEHISSHFMIYYVLLKTYEDFEDSFTQSMCSPGCNCEEEDDGEMDR